MVGGGLLGILFLVFVATAGVPLPAELAVIYGGYLVAADKAPAWAVFLVSWLGSTAGALALYALARHAGRDAFTSWGRRIGLSRKDLRRAEGFFEHGGWAVAAARCVPGLRTVVSVPAGIAKMPTARFTLWTLAGLAPMTAVLMGIGYVLEDQWEEAGPWTTVVAVVVGALALALTAFAWWRAQRDDDA